MMKRLYAIKDQLTTFKAPFILENDNVAKREFKAIVNDNRSNMYYAPNYFDLYFIGEFDEDTAELIPAKKIELICNGVSVLEATKDV